MSEWCFLCLALCREKLINKIEMAEGHLLRACNARLSLKKRIICLVVNLIKSQFALLSYRKDKAMMVQVQRQTGTSLVITSDMFLNNNDPVNV